MDEFILQLIARLDNSKIPDDIKTIEQNLAKKGINLKTVLDTTTSKKEIETLAKQLQSVMANIDPKFNNVSWKQWQSAINSVVSSTNRVKTELSELDRNIFRNQLEAWKRVNSNAKELFYRIDAIENSLSTIDDNSGLKELKKQFREVNAAADALGIKGKSFGDTFKSGAQKFTEWLGPSTIIMSTMHQAEKMGEAVYDIDTAMTELAKVSDATFKQLDNSLKTSVKTAKTYAGDVSDVINATADWSRLGYDLDQSKKLAEVATIYKNVGDGINIDSANKSLVSTLQGFQLEADEALSIIDKFNEVANNFPIDTAGIGEALQRSAASFYAANTDLSKSIALISGTNSVVQDPDSVGTMWKTVSMRIRGATTELEAAGLETDGVIESTSELQSLVKGMTGFDIMKDEDTFKDIYEIIIGIGEEWKNLTDIQKASLLEALAGKRQGNALSAALNNIDMIKEAYQTAENSAGSAMKEQETYLSSLEAKTQQFKASVQSLSNTLLDSDILKFFVDLGTDGVNAIESIVKALTPLGTVGVIGGGIFGAKNLGKCRISVRISNNLLNCFEYALLA